MIGICPKCGNYEWDKRVRGDTVSCPKCGHSWGLRKLPLFILSGCSGVGKTTTAQAIMQRAVDFVVLDADMFYGVMTIKTEEDERRRVEQMMNLSRNIAQSGQPVLWTMAGNLDKLHSAYNRQFFSEIACLALTCEEAALRRRMAEGRGITDQNWIESSVDYNRYFMTHDRLGDMAFDTLDITGKTPDEVAENVIAWVHKRWTEIMAS